MQEWESKAFNFAKSRHRNQLDDNREPYFKAHILQVIKLLKIVTRDKAVITAGYLHDTLEDTKTTYEELEENFGKEVAGLVSEVTHDGKKNQIGYYYPRLHSEKAILLKFADRLSNISRMESWSKKRRNQYLRKSKFWKSEPR